MKVKFLKNLMSECHSSGLEENKRSLLSFLVQNGHHPVNHMETPNKELKKLFEAVSQKKQPQKEIDLEHLPLAEFGMMKMKSGERYKGVAFKDIYPDQVYNKWVIDHYQEGKSSQGLKEYVIYLNRRLRADLEADGH